MKPVLLPASLQRTMIKGLTLVVVAMAACSKANELDALDALRSEAAAIARSNQPRLDALVARVDALKRSLRGNLPGWQNMLRTAELANDLLGLPPFTQTVAPGPAWKPSPASLLGISNYARVRADELARHAKRHELEYLIEDERQRYEQGIAEVEEHLSEIESWLRAGLRDGPRR